MQENEASAESVCDQKIREWLTNRKKHAPSRRKRTRKKSNRNTPTKQCNTPKRSTNKPRRSTRSSGCVRENFFSPTAPSMTSMPPVIEELNKKQRATKRTKQKKGRKKQTPDEVSLYVACAIYTVLPVCFFLACVHLPFYHFPVCS